MNKHLTWKTILDFSRRYFDKDVPTTTPLKKEMKITSCSFNAHCHLNQANNVQYTYWSMWMCRYFPNRLELLFSIVLALPKLSRMGKTSIG